MSPPADPARGTRGMIVTGDVRRSVWVLAWPALGEQLLSLGIGLFDTYLAGHVPNASGELGVYTSTVGAAGYMSWLAGLMFSIISWGATALIAQAWGSGDFSRANRVLNVAMGLGALFGLGVASLLYAVAPAYARLLGMQGEAHDIVVNYLRTDALGQLFFGFCLIGGAALRGAGDMRTPLLVLGGVDLMNAAISSVLVFGWGPVPPWGINGVVGGTLAARVLGGLIMLALLCRGVGGLRVRPAAIWSCRTEMRPILTIGLPAVVDNLLMWSGQAAFLSLVARLPGAGPGKTTMAAHVIGMQVEALTYLPAVAWGYAAATVIGQSLGSGDAGRAMQAGHAAVRQCLWFGVAGAAVYYFGASGVYQLLSSEPAVHALGAPALRTLSAYQLPLVVLIVYLNAMRGAGDTRTPLWINLLGIFGLRLPLAYLWGYVWHGGLIGAWSAMMIDVTFRAGLAAWRYHRGDWLP